MVAWRRGRITSTEQRLAGSPGNPAVVESSVSVDGLIAAGNLQRGSDCGDPEIGSWETHLLLLDKVRLNDLAKALALLAGSELVTDYSHHKVP